MLTTAADRQKGSVKSRISQGEGGTDVEVKGAGVRPRRTLGEKRQAMSRRGTLTEDDFGHLGKFYLGLGTSGTKTSHRGQYSEESVRNVLRRNALRSARICGQT